MASSKTSNPFQTQAASWLLGSLFSPQFMQLTQQMKPGFWNHLFGGQDMSQWMPGGEGGLTGDIGRYRRYTQEYRPPLCPQLHQR